MFPEMGLPPDHLFFRGLFMIVHYKTSHKSHKWGLTHIYGHLYIIHKWGITWYYHLYGRLPLIYTVTIYEQFMPQHSPGHLTELNSLRKLPNLSAWAKSGGPP